MQRPTAQEKLETLKFANLNEVIGKPVVLNRNSSVHQVSQVRPSVIIDYSKSTVALTLSGPLELKQGLALTDNNRIEIHRENKGQVVEYGDVDIEKGTYAIKFSNAEGHVCARLRGSQHEIIGEGCFSLDRINKSTTAGPMLSVSRYKDILAFSDKYTEPPAPANIDRLKNIEKSQIQTQSKTGSFGRARVIDFYDYDSSEAKDLAAKFETAVNNLEDSGSHVVMTITTPNHPATRLVANNQTHKRGVMIPNNKANDSLKKLAQDAGYSSAEVSGGTVWGRTTNEGRSVAGAQVEVEGRDDLRPLYLNEFYIPDPNQKFTASHGLYTVVGVPDGEYAIRATQGNKFMGFQNISVRKNMLSIADIDATDRRRPVRIAAYDLINKTSQSVVATLQNHEEDIVIENGQADVAVQDNLDTAYALVNPLNKKYMTAQYVLPPGEALYNFPMVTSEWVETILLQAKLEKPLRNKIILGLGAQKSFRVEAVGSKTAQVIYFDSEGQVVEGNFGSAGGGFFILDPEESVIEYAVQSAGEKTVRSIYLPTIPNVLNIIQL